MQGTSRRAIPLTDLPQANLPRHNYPKRLQYEPRKPGTTRYHVAPGLQTAPSAPQFQIMMPRYTLGALPIPPVPETTLSGTFPALRALPVKQPYPKKCGARLPLVTEPHTQSVPTPLLVRAKTGRNQDTENRNFVGFGQICWTFPGPLPLSEFHSIASAAPTCGSVTFYTCRGAARARLDDNSSQSSNLDARPTGGPMADNVMTDVIAAYDERGRPVFIPRQQWADEVLPESLKAAWNEPDQLRAHVLVGIDDGFAELLLDAAKRLASIDPLLQRGSATLALVQLENGLVDAARATLRDALDVVGD